MADELFSPGVAEIVKHLREDITREQIATHNRIQVLSERREESKSQEAFDRWTEEMRRTSSEGYARIEPIRKQLDAIYRAIASLHALQPLAPIIISKEQAADAEREEQVSRF